MLRLPMAWFETQWAPRDAGSDSSVREYIWKNRNLEIVSSLFVRSLALCRAGRLDEARDSLARLDPMEADERHRPYVKAQIAFAKARIVQAEGTPNDVEEILAASNGIEEVIPLMRVILSHED